MYRLSSGRRVVITASWLSRWWRRWCLKYSPAINQVTFVIYFSCTGRHGNWGQPVRRNLLYAARVKTVLHSAVSPTAQRTTYLEQSGDITGDLNVTTRKFKTEDILFHSLLFVENRVTRACDSSSMTDTWRLNAV